MLNVQEYLKTHSLNHLKADHGVNSSWKPGDHKFSLNYDQIESKAGPLTNECRGLILARPRSHLFVESLDEVVGETIVMARPMDRFFNHGDPNAVNIGFSSDISPPVFLEKLDGTLCILYFDSIKEEWHVATRSVPEANIPIDGFTDLTFRKLFEKGLRTVANKTFAQFTCDLDTDMTYCFELTGPENRVVVAYPDTRITHLTSRKKTDGWEELPVLDLCGVPAVKRYSLGSLPELLDFVNSQNPMEHEGVVVADESAGTINRVKVKNAAYLAYNRARDIVGKSPRALLEIILLEKMDDVLPMLPEHLQARATEMQNSLRLLVHEIDQNYLACKAIADKDMVNPRKAFCLHAQANKMWLEPLINRFLGRHDSTGDFLKKHQNKDGSFGDSFLDNVLTQLKRFSQS